MAFSRSHSVAEEAEWQQHEARVFGRMRSLSAPRLLAYARPKTPRRTSSTRPLTPMPPPSADDQMVNLEDALMSASLAFPPSIVPPVRAHHFDTGVRETEATPAEAAEVEAAAVAMCTDAPATLPPLVLSDQDEVFLAAAVDPAPIFPDLPDDENTINLRNAIASGVVLIERATEATDPSLPMYDLAHSTPYYVRAV